MIEDAHALPAHTRLDSQVCVVGAGPAGIALALALGEQLASRNHKGLAIVLDQGLVNLGEVSHSSGLHNKAR